MDDLWFSGGEDSGEMACEGVPSKEDLVSEPDDCSTLSSDSDDSGPEAQKWISLTAFSEAISLLDVTRVFVSKVRRTSYVIMRHNKRERKRKNIQPVTQTEEEIDDTRPEVLDPLQAESCNSPPPTESNSKNLKTPEKKATETDEPQRVISHTPPLLECDCCLFRCTSSESLRLHMPIHKQETSTYYCDRCRIRFRGLDPLKEHLRKHEETEPWTCLECNFETFIQRDWKQHVASHKAKWEKFVKEVNSARQEHTKETVSPVTSAVDTGSGAPTSEYASTTPNAETLTAKRRRKQVIQPNRAAEVVDGTAGEAEQTFNVSLSAFECDSCLFKTSDAETLKTHMSIHPVERQYECYSCGVRYLRLRGLRRHKMMAGHGNICKECSYSAMSMRDLERHILNIHGRVVRISRQAIPLKKVHKCDECGSLFPKKYELKIHTWTRHGGHNFANENLTCGLCNFKARFLVELKRHMECYHDGAPFFCDVCGFTTISLPQFNRHKKTHKPQVGYTCYYCHYQSYERGIFNRHINGHLRHPRETENTFVKEKGCNLCEFKTLFRTALEKHLVTHTVARNFTCYHCSRKVFTLKQMRHHMDARHSDVRLCHRTKNSIAAKRSSSTLETAAARETVLPNLTARNRTDPRRTRGICRTARARNVS